MMFKLFGVGFLRASQVPFAGPCRSDPEPNSRATGGRGHCGALSSLGQR